MRLLQVIALSVLIPQASEASVILPPETSVREAERAQPKAVSVTGETLISTEGDRVGLAVDAPSVSASGTTSPKVQRPFDVGNMRPPARTDSLPRTRWQHRPSNRIWTRAALSALKGHGAPLVQMEPADITNWCPAYATNPAPARRAFWVGFLSALAKYESTYKAGAVGGGGKWYGLLQILPGTARGYGCVARSGSALKNGAANLSCAIRIMAVTVPRDGVIYGRGGRGVAADWGPMRSSRKRGEMAAWLRGQSYCKPMDATRPRSRP